MSKIWLIARTTYWRRVRSGTFLFLTFALPALMVAAGVFGFIQARGGGSDLTEIGYVDQTGQLMPVELVESGEAVVNLVRMADVQAAREANRSGRIEAFVVIPAGYFEGEPVRFYGEEAPGEGVESALETFLRRALLPGASEAVLERLDDPMNVHYVSLESGAEVSEGVGLVIRILIPIALALLFALAVMFTTSQMGAAVVREKDQRAMEMVITSLRPMELVSGKVLGMALLTLTQFGIWVLAGILALVLVALGGDGLPELSLPWEAIGWGLLLIFPGYLLFAMLGAGVGILAGDSQQAQQLAGLFGLLGFVPIWLTTIWINDPNGAAAVALTLFPLTAPAVALMRMTFTEVPTWQLAASLVLLLLGLALSTWMVARIFRAAMLVYGQALRPRQIWQALRQA